MIRALAMLAALAATAHADPVAAASGSMEDAITSHEERQTALPEAPPDYDDHVTTYTLGAKGPCETSP